MEIFDLMNLETQGYENRSVNAFFKTTFSKHG